MSNYEKLIELMKEVGQIIVKRNDADHIIAATIIDINTDINWEQIADHLMENNVTIQKRGYWEECETDKYGPMSYRCPFCYHVPDQGWTAELPHYCEMCGAELRDEIWRDLE